MNKTQEPSEQAYTRWLRRYGPVVVLYVLATLFTNAYYMGDTRIYVKDILEASGYQFWDFGHILWRPLGWLLDLMFRPLTRVIGGDDAQADVALILMAVSWISGLGSVLLVHALARRFCQRGWCIYLVTAACLFANAFLNYSQSGHSYIPGLALLLLGLYVLVVGGEKTTPSLLIPLLAGAALALSAAMWFPFVLSIPAILICPLFLFGFNRSELRLTSHTIIAFTLVIIVIYAMVLMHLSITNFSGLKAWILSSAHGVDGMKGVPRMIFGFARSLINMGNDGRVFKRYVVGDPLNPVSFFDLFRLSLWKVGLFYTFFFSVLINLLFSRLGRRALALFVLSAAPLIGFALFLFESGTIDRYLPLYPMFFLALSVSLRSDNAWSVTKVATGLFVVAAIISNVNAMAKGTLDRQQEMAAARIVDLQSLLKPGNSRVITIGEQDPVYAFNVNFLFHPLNRRGRFQTDPIVAPGTVLVLTWRNIFAAKTLALWDRGGDVWITKRLLHSHPSPEWEWVEGDDPRVTWKDIYSFFAQLEMGQSVGGEDGFVLVEHSPRNEQFLRGFVVEKK